MEVDLSELRSASSDWESRVSKVLGDDEEMSEQIRDLEQQYDDDLINHASDDLSASDPFAEGE